MKPLEEKTKITLVILLAITSAFCQSCKYHEEYSDLSSTETASADFHDISFDVKTSGVCKNYQEPIELFLSFENLTDRTIKFADQFILSKNRFGAGGNIIPNLTLNGENIYSLRDNSMFDIPLPDVQDFVEIPPMGILRRSIQYFFPAEILESRQDNLEIIVTPTPGKYSISFTYYQWERGAGNWYGNIESNQIEICLK